MSEDRTYDDEEIREIFGRATSSEEAAPVARASTRGDGLTLSELQAIGREVGLTPERVAEAAAALDRAGRPTPTRSMLGVPVGVGRVVELPRAPTDREWEILVAELRQTFGAKGRVESHGDLRSWTNSRLHAHVEATPSGYRLRIGTVKGNALSLGAVGIIALAAGVLWTIAAIVGGEAIGRPVAYALFGAATLVANAIRLPPWAAERERQMEHIAERAGRLLADPSREDGADRGGIDPP